VFRPSRGKGALKKSCHKAIYFINQILPDIRLKKHIKYEKQM
jgi:hypothetical protein